VIELATLYQIGQMVGMAVLATLFIVMIKADVKVLKVQMRGIGDNITILNASFTKLSDVLTKAAVLDERQSRLEDDVRELRHGRGFVQQDINGEYARGGKVRTP